MQDFEYAVLGGSLLLSVGLFLVCLLFFSFRKSWAIHPGRTVGVVKTNCLGWIDLAGVGLVFAIFLCNWIDLGQVHSEKSLSYGLMLSQFVLQMGFVGVVIGVLYHRASIEGLWGLRPGRYWWITGASFVGLLFYFVALELLWAIGFEDWTGRVFQRLPGEASGRGLEPTVTYWALWALITVVGAPLMEEVVFRGYLYPVLKRMGGIWLAALTVSLFFAAAHLEGSHLLGRFLLGLILIAAFELTGSLWAPLGIHVLNNLYVFIGNFVE